MSTSYHGITKVAAEPPKQFKGGKSKEPRAIMREAVPVENRLTLLEDIAIKIEEWYSDLTKTLRIFVDYTITRWDEERKT